MSTVPSMPGGRKRPLALRVIEGNPSGRPLDGEVEPDLYETIPKPTPLVVEAGEGAMAFWHELGEQLTTLGMLSSLDMQAFEQLCVTRALWQTAAARALAEPGEPQVQRIVELHSIRMIGLLGHFGMTPAMRGKVTVKGIAGKKTSVVSKLAAGRGEPGK